MLSVAVPFRFAQSESCPAVSSKMLVSDDDMRRRGAGNWSPPASPTTRNDPVLSGRKTSAKPHASAAAPSTITRASRTAERGGRVTERLPGRAAYIFGGGHFDR